MSKSDDTIETWEAKGLLLGMVYDPHDHTFGNVIGIYDADTLVSVTDDYVEGGAWDARKAMVARGELGASDYAEVYRYRMNRWGLR